MTLRSEPTTHENPPALEEPVSIEVVRDLLEALLEPLEYPSEKPPHSLPNKSPVPMDATTDADDNTIIINDEANEENDCIMLPAASDGDCVMQITITEGTCDFRVPPTLNNITATDDNRVAPSSSDGNSAIEGMDVDLVESQNSTQRTRVKKADKELACKPLLSKHSILKLLADAVLSYSPIIKYIVEFNYKAGCSPHVNEGCSVLAFMFDKLLPVTDNLSDRDTSMMCKVLLAAIASANHCADARSILVTEVKSALNRALLMPECAEKHIQV